MLLEEWTQKDEEVLHPSNIEAQMVRERGDTPGKIDARSDVAKLVAEICRKARVGCDFNKIVAVQNRANMYRNPLYGVSPEAIQLVIIIAKGDVGFSLGPMPQGFDPVTVNWDRMVGTPGYYDEPGGYRLSVAGSRQLVMVASPPGDPSKAGQDRYQALEGSDEVGAGSICSAESRHLRVLRA